MTTPNLDRYTLEKAIEICVAQRWRGTASQLEVAIDDLQRLAASLPQEPAPSWEKIISDLKSVIAHATEVPQEPAVLEEWIEALRDCFEALRARPLGHNAMSREAMANAERLLATVPASVEVEDLSGPRQDFERSIYAQTDAEDRQQASGKADK